MGGRANQQSSRPWEILSVPILSKTHRATLQQEQLSAKH